MRLTIVAAAFAAAASLSFPFSSAFAAGTGPLGGGSGPMSGLSDPMPYGEESLGVDITGAGNTHHEVQNFLATLEPGTRQRIVDGCRHYLQNPEQAQTSTAVGSVRTVAFCKLAL
jgi:hypothetical protein